MAMADELLGVREGISTKTIFSRMPTVFGATTIPGAQKRAP